jgi:hypothetical protein
VHQRDDDNWEDEDKKVHDDIELTWMEVQLLVAAAFFDWHNRSEDSVMVH